MKRKCTGNAVILVVSRQRIPQGGHSAATRLLQYHTLAMFIYICIYFPIPHTCNIYLYILQYHTLAISQYHTSDPQKRQHSNIAISPITWTAVLPKINEKYKPD